MKKTIAVIGSAAALSFAGAGLASAQSELPGLDAGSAGATEVEGVDTPEDVSEIAAQVCGSIAAYDLLGSVEGVSAGLSGDECEANADAAVEAAFSGDFALAIDILQGVDVDISDDDATDALVGDENVEPGGDDEGWVGSVE